MYVFVSRKVSDVLFNCVKRQGMDKEKMSSALARDLVFILREDVYYSVYTSIILVFISCPSY